MFTGIITGLGIIRQAEGGDAGRQLTVECTGNPEYAANRLSIGESIACNGVCLTLTGKTPSRNGALMLFDLSPETLARTAHGRWEAGRKVNLERALRAGDSLSGHFVTGHVDGTAEVLDVEKSKNHSTMRLLAPELLKRFIAEKGSVTLDGVSLTVNALENAGFSVTIVPHTLAMTTLGERGRGDQLNLEVDLIARYAARLLQE